MSGPFKLKYKNSSFPFKKGEKYKLKLPTPPKIEVSKHVGLIQGEGTSKKLSAVLPKGFYGGASVTYRPTKKLTLHGSTSGSISKYGPKGGTSGFDISLQKKFKKGKFSFGVSKHKGEKPSYRAGISLNI